ncbi:MAG: DedA family protein [bacterium]|nr:DedA family protein [bacterium]
MHLDISQWLLNYRYLILFPLIVLEGPITVITAGVLTSVGLLNFFLVYFVAVIGDLAGDSLYYSIGRYGRKHLDRWGRFIGLPKERLEKMETHFKDHGGKTLIAGKLSHAIGAIVLVSAGIARIPFRKFIIFNLWATLPKSLVLLLIGYYFGNTFIHLQRYFDFAWLGALVATVLFILVYLFLRKTGKKLEEE